MNVLIRDLFQLFLLWKVFEKFHTPVPHGRQNGGGREPVFFAYLDRAQDLMFSY